MGLSLAFLLGAALPAQAGEFTTIDAFGSNPGNLWSSIYEPTHRSSPAVLVVALHGCLQDGRIYATEAGWSDLAERYGWTVLLPEQPVFNNPLRCFDWFLPDQASRDKGEALSIRQMIETVARKIGVGPDRTYVTGLSAGGAMSAVMLAAYPELFAGGGIIAGVPYACATDAGSAFQCMNPGRNLTASGLAKRVERAAPAPASRALVTIWQGDEDTTVVPKNAEELVEQWGTVAGIDLKAGQKDKLHGFARTTWSDAAGHAALQLVSVPGMGHAVPVDPGEGPQSCGTIGTYTAPVGVCSSLEIARFWGIVPP
jgi:poly(hydroxyalkanoate) depolymerase family esterase